MKTISIKKVKQPQLLKISLLVAILVTLPKTLFIYNLIDKGRMDVSDVSMSEFIFQLLLLFFFSWIVLQLSANWTYQYIKNPIIRIVTNIVLGIAILLFFLQLLLYVYPLITDHEFARQERGFLLFNYVTLFLVLFFVSRVLRLQVIQKESLIENEQLKRQSLQNELSALKNQIDPHFLFNSLNSLNSLIRDNTKATDFVTKLSFMYRYILQSSDRDLVSVKEELKFLDSYIYLIKTRYRDRFSITINIDEKDLEKEVPPLALQVLVENAVKHNEISKTNPLEVKIYTKDDAICVENKIRPRSTLAEGTGNGLLNLEKRYYLLGRQKPIITQENQIFNVKIPLLKIS